MRPEWHHLGGNQCVRRGLPVQQSQTGYLQRRSGDREATPFPQRTPECYEVVEGFFNGIADEVVDGVTELFQRSPGRQATVDVVAVGDPAQSVHDAR